MTSALSTIKRAGIPSKPVAFLEESLSIFEHTTLNFKGAQLITTLCSFLGCVHRRNSYIRLDLGFQYGRFFCDGSRFLYIIVMHCIVNVENHQY